jgi:hypothetical protein
MHYTAVNLRAADKVRFRYRLAGFDEHWTEAGSRRAAFYTNVPPGRYRFEVVASNEDGVWSERGAALDFRLRPSFHQTVWFRAGCLAALAALAFAFHRHRLHAHERRERELRGHVELALARLEALRGLLPLCAWCRKVRDEGGTWEQIESCVARHSEAGFGHGICPECLEQHYPDVASFDGQQWSGKVPAVPMPSSAAD